MKYQIKTTEQNTFRSHHVRLFATFCVAFLLAGICSGTLSSIEATSALECVDSVTSSGVCSTDTTDVNVSVTGAWTLSISSSGTLNLSLTPTSSGTFSTVTDNLNIYTNIPTGYQLYLNSTSGSTDIYNSSDTEQTLTHFTATTGTKDAPIALSSNTWGYSLDASSATFSKVPLTSEDADSNIYSNPTKTSSSGDNIPVTYGFKADTSLTPGTYSTSVTYTAIADAPTYAITNVSPNELKLDGQTNKTITIMTSTPATELAFGNISAKITDGTNTVNLTDCTEITSDGYRGVECTYNGNLDYGTYNVELTSSWHNATYTLVDGVRIGSTFDSITSMQEMTGDICKNAPIDTVKYLIDTRDGQSYRVTKLADNNCWTTSNMNYATSGSVNNKSGYDGRLYTWAQALNTCPANWILPPNSGTKSYTNLFTKYTLNMATAEADPLYFSRTGGYISNWYGQGVFGYYWSSTAKDNNFSYSFFYNKDSGEFNTQYNYYKTFYYSVRCVFGE